MRRHFKWVLPFSAMLAISGCKSGSDLQDEINALQKTLEELTQQLGDQQNTQNTLANQLAELRKQIEENGDENGDLQAQVESLQKAIDFTRVYMTELGSGTVLAKAVTLVGSYIIIRDYSGFMAVDISDWVTNTSALNYYLAGLSEMSDYGIPRSIASVADLGNGNYEFFDGSQSYVFEDTSNHSRDLEKLGGKIENAQLARVAKTLVNRFGFSEDRGIKAARMIHQWELLKKSRAVTARDANAFSKELVGFDFNEMRQAVENLENGNTENLKSIVARAATLNGTTPEAMNELISILK